MNLARSGYGLGIGLAVGTIVLFSLKAIFAKFAYRHGVDAISMMGLRMSFSLPFFIGVAIWLRRDPTLVPLTGRDLVAVAALGIVGYFFSSWFDFIGLQYISAGVERLILFAYPTMVVMLSALFFAKPVKQRELISLVVTYTGVALVVSGMIGGEQRNFMLGALFVLTSAFGYAIYLVFGSETIKRIGANRFTAYAMIAASVPAIAMWVISRPSEPFSMTAPAYGWSFTLAIFSTVVPIFMQSGALKRIGANHFAVLGALGPLCTILAGYIALGERLSPLQWAGAAFVVGGVMIVTLRGPTPPQRPLH